MGGGLMQLVAYGAQDIYLTGNPQITFFKVVYRRHTNFAMESIEQTFNGSVDYARRLTCTLDRSGDLVHKMYLEVEVDVVDDPLSTTEKCSQNFVSGVGNDNNYGARVSVSADGVSNFETGQGYANNLGLPRHGRFGHSLIDEVEVEIGGQSIDKHYGEWLEIWSQLTSTDLELTKNRLMIDGTMVNTGPTTSMKVSPATAGTSGIVGGSRKVVVPLQFWFNRNPGLALPLIALQYHEVKINLVINSRQKAGLSPNSNCGCCEKITQLSLFCDYIFLDTDERRRFAQVSHEYLIEQLQFNNIVNADKTESSKNVELRFNHPCKELVWVVQPQSNVVKNTINDSGPRGSLPTAAGNGNGAYSQVFNFNNEPNSGNTVFTGGYDATDWNLDSMTTAKLQLNGHDRIEVNDAKYFRTVQLFQHHTGGQRQLGGTDTDPAFASGGAANDVLDGAMYGVRGCIDGGIYCYSFALKPEEHQPSGTCNFSRIDNAVLQLGLNTRTANGTGASQFSKFIKIYATNYNVLRIMSGMGGLAYSN